MWMKLKCWILGHLYKQVGFSRVCNQLKAEDGHIIKQTTADHFLFRCTRCGELKEYHCKTWYNQISEQIESNIQE